MIEEMSIDQITRADIAQDEDDDEDFLEEDQDYEESDEADSTEPDHGSVKQTKTLRRTRPTTARARKVSMIRKQPPTLFPSHVNPRAPARLVPTAVVAMGAEAIAAVRPGSGDRSEAQIESALTDPAATPAAAARPCRPPTCPPSPTC